MISIVIPVYNAGVYLSDMLDSIVGQSYKEIEVILVNDGSTDNSSIICHEYAERYSNITVYDRENYGVSATRNFGIEKASGEFIWFMDSDDVLEKDALIHAVEAQKQYDADIVIGGMNFCFTEEDRIVPKAVEKDIVLNEQEFKRQYKQLFSLNYISALWNKLIRRSVIIENDIKMDESLYMYEDYLFCMDVLLECKTVVCLSSIFYNYALRNTKSLSHRYKERAIDMFCALERKISRYIEIVGSESAVAERSLNNLVIYLAYECVRNEARHKNSYRKVKKILCDKSFHAAMLKYNSTGKNYRIVQMMMKNKMAFLLLVYLVINRKV